MHRCPVIAYVVHSERTTNPAIFEALASLRGDISNESVQHAELAAAISKDVLDPLARLKDGSDTVARITAEAKRVTKNVKAAYDRCRKVFERYIKAYRKAAELSTSAGLEPPELWLPPEFEHIRAAAAGPASDGPIQMPIRPAPRSSSSSSSGGSASVEAGLKKSPTTDSRRVDSPLSRPLDATHRGAPLSDLSIGSQTQSGSEAAATPHTSPETAAFSAFVGDSGNAGHGTLGGGLGGATLPSETHATEPPPSSIPPVATPEAGAPAIYAETVASAAAVSNVAQDGELSSSSVSNGPSSGDGVSYHEAPGALPPTSGPLSGASAVAVIPDGAGNSYGDTGAAAAAASDAVVAAAEMSRADSEALPSAMSPLSTVSSDCNHQSPVPAVQSSTENAAAATATATAFADSPAAAAVTVDGIAVSHSVSIGAATPVSFADPSVSVSDVVVTSMTPACVAEHTHSGAPPVANESLPAATAVAAVPRSLDGTAPSAQSTAAAVTTSTAATTAAPTPAAAAAALKPPATAALTRAAEGAKLPAPLSATATAAASVIQRQPSSLRGAVGGGSASTRSGHHHSSASSGINLAHAYSLSSGGGDGGGIDFDDAASVSTSNSTENLSVALAGRMKGIFSGAAMFNLSALVGTPAYVGPATQSTADRIAAMRETALAAVEASALLEAECKEAWAAHARAKAAFTSEITAAVTVFTELERRRVAEMCDAMRRYTVFVSSMLANLQYDVNRLATVVEDSGAIATSSAPSISVPMIGMATARMDAALTAFTASSTGRTPSAAAGGGNGFFNGGGSGADVGGGGGGLPAQVFHALSRTNSSRSSSSSNGGGIGGGNGRQAVSTAPPTSSTVGHHPQQQTVSRSNGPSDSDSGGGGSGSPQRMTPPRPRRAPAAHHHHHMSSAFGTGAADNDVFDDDDDDAEDNDDASSTGAVSEVGVDSDRGEVTGDLIRSPVASISSDDRSTSVIGRADMLSQGLAAAITSGGSASSTAVAAPGSRYSASLSSTSSATRSSASAVRGFFSNVFSPNSSSASSSSSPAHQPAAASAAAAAGQGARGGGRRDSSSSDTALDAIISSVSGTWEDGGSSSGSGGGGISRLFSSLNRGGGSSSSAGGGATTAPLTINTAVSGVGLSEMASNPNTSSGGSGVYHPHVVSPLVPRDRRLSNAATAGAIAVSSPREVSFEGKAYESAAAAAPPVLSGRPPLPGPGGSASESADAVSADGMGSTTSGGGGGFLLRRSLPPARPPHTPATAAAIAPSAQHASSTSGGFGRLLSGLSRLGTAASSASSTVAAAAVAGVVAVVPAPPPVTPPMPAVGSRRASIGEPSAAGAGAGARPPLQPQSGIGASRRASPPSLPSSSSAAAAAGASLHISPSASSSSSASSAAAPSSSGGGVSVSMSLTGSIRGGIHSSTGAAVTGVDGSQGRESAAAMGRLSRPGPIEQFVAAVFGETLETQQSQSAQQWGVTPPGALLPARSIYRGRVGSRDDASIPATVVGAADPAFDYHDRTDTPPSEQPQGIISFSMSEFASDAGAASHPSSSSNSHAVEGEEGPAGATVARPSAGSSTSPADASTSCADAVVTHDRGEPADAHPVVVGSEPAAAAAAAAGSEDTVRSDTSPEPATASTPEVKSHTAAAAAPAPVQARAESATSSTVAAATIAAAASSSASDDLPLHPSVLSLLPTALTTLKSSPDGLARLVVALDDRRRDGPRIGRAALDALWVVMSSALDCAHARSDYARARALMAASQTFYAVEEGPAIDPAAAASKRSNSSSSSGSEPTPFDLLDARVASVLSRVRPSDLPAQFQSSTPFPSGYPAAGSVEEANQSASGAPLPPALPTAAAATATATAPSFRRGRVYIQSRILGHAAWQDMQYWESAVFESLGAEMSGAIPLSAFHPSGGTAVPLSHLSSGGGGESR